jgi:hypothetical protein
MHRGDPLGHEHFVRKQNVIRKKEVATSARMSGCERRLKLAANGL